MCQLIIPMMTLLKVFETNDSRHQDSAFIKSAWPGIVRKQFQCSKVTSMKANLLHKFRTSMVVFRETLSQLLLLSLICFCFCFLLLFLLLLFVFIVVFFFFEFLLQNKYHLSVPMRHKYLSTAHVSLLQKFNGLCHISVGKWV